jgi:hypothetical protein
MDLDKHGRVDQEQLRNSLIYNFTRSSLNGFKPEDGATYGVDGSPESWAEFMMWLCQKESDFDPKAGGDVGVFRGGSNGLFQLSPDDALNYHFSKLPFTLKELQDPEFNTRMAVAIMIDLVRKHNSIRHGAGLYWGPIKRGLHP